MPVVIRAVPVGIERDDLRRLCGILVIEQQQLDQRGVLREDAEVDAAGRGAEAPSGGAARRLVTALPAGAIAVTAASRRDRA